MGFAGVAAVDWIFVVGLVVDFLCFDDFEGDVLLLAEGFRFFEVGAFQARRVGNACDRSVFAQVFAGEVDDEGGINASGESGQAPRDLLEPLV